jgi:hypothetical protein
MALEFKTDAAVGGAELFINMDFEGLHAFMEAFEAALATGRAHLTLESGGGSPTAGGGSPNAFGKVTLSFAGPD